MRYSMTAAALALGLVACSAGPDSVAGPAGPLTPPPTRASTLWIGSEACGVGLVRVEVELFGNGAIDPSALVLDDAIVRISIDGELVNPNAPRLFRSGGLRVHHDAGGETLEVFAGLGGSCDWITTVRVS